MASPQPGAELGQPLNVVDQFTEFFQYQEDAWRSFTWRNSRFHPQLLSNI